MTEREILDQIEIILKNIGDSKGISVPKIEPGTQLLGGNLAIDSLDLASLVFELEQATGRDPFKQGFINFQTAGELANLYRQ